MNIKIPPYPNFQITEQAVNRDVLPNTEKKTNSSGLSNNLVFVLEFKTGQRRVIKARPIKYQGKLFVTAFPNPVHLFLSTAIENYDNSELGKEKFLVCGKKYGDDLYLLDFEENGTHECYNHYIKYRASSIIMLVSSLEAFLNHIIPNGFVYRTIRKGKAKDFNKEELESPSIAFKEKLTGVIPQWLNNENFWRDNNIEESSILELYENRRNIIHLKTNTLDDFNRYFETIDKMLDFDILGAINSSIKFMNLVEANFIEFETT